LGREGNILLPLLAGRPGLREAVKAPELLESDDDATGAMPWLPAWLPARLAGAVDEHT
jgi:hypothetical protein